MSRYFEAYLGQHFSWHFAILLADLMPFTLHLRLLLSETKFLLSRVQVFPAVWSAQIVALVVHVFGADCCSKSSGRLQHGHYN